jgi:hypothetical protein
MPQLIQPNVFDWIELDASKRDGSWKPATNFRVAPNFSRRSKTVLSQGSFRRGRIFDLQEQGMSISDFSSRR